MGKKDNPVDIVRAADPNIPKKADVVYISDITSKMGKKYRYVLIKESGMKYFISDDNLVFVLGEKGSLIQIN
jgi:predicted transcriptional regulator